VTERARTDFKWDAGAINTVTIDKRAKLCAPLKVEAFPGGVERHGYTTYL
jgi:hypothetical protein